ncbi:BT4734/BF3469 family protein [uncultured Bacteroides sp.]|uniref:BT4734/BF3469 family protein n=1 Tax=uncultured Bacteroides sp. TaxID=162156 RepID=UPI00267704A1|nr:BT4734/BF3469 family protein [uncultured Bacteroides sp.]
MSNNYRMSYFMPPIAPIKDKQGRLTTPPTLIPFCEVSIGQVFQMITCNKNLKALTEQVRNAADIRAAKASLLPYVTPCGTFTRRNSKNFVSPSHLVVVDVDGLLSHQEAVDIRRMLYDDSLLQPALTFISPSGLGVKAFVPCHYSSAADDVKNITENMSWAMRYVETAYNTVTAVSSETKSKVDFSGKDLVRACFLSYDPEALFRTK